MADEVTTVGWIAAASAPLIIVVIGVGKKVLAGLKIASQAEEKLKEARLKARRRENRRLRVMKREIEETTGRMIELRNEELTNVRERLASIEAKEKMLKEQLQENLIKIQQLTSDNVMLQGKVDRQDETIRMQTTRIKAQQEEIEKLRADLGRLGGEGHG